jgi:hypothetical protein
MWVLISFLSGFFSALGAVGVFVYWLCRRLGNVAIAKAVNGLANAILTTRSKSSKPSIPADDRKAKAGSQADDK